MSQIEYKEDKQSDITWYFFIRTLIVIVVAIAYIMSILKDIEYVNFAVLSCIYFLPFILDYALKDTKSNSRKMQKYIGLCFPCLTVIFLMSLNYFSYEHFNIAEDYTVSWIKYIFFAFSVLFILFAMLDFNYYTKNKKQAIKDRSIIKVTVDDEFKESFMDAMRKLENDKKESYKELAIKSSK
ncbi:hypothetical protein [Mammaliicoccus sciuri]|uniref:hypothetical protein n=1 Tax=Mammaliicoccus sciuri TaxID=1296 RepID=UPI0019510A6D|nr:hypothetical protein [Mammaliicoccus sciuri]